MRIYVVLAALLLIPSLLSATDKSRPADNTPCVSLRITNGYERTISVAPAPASLVAEVRIQKRAEHRYVVVEWDYAPQDASDARSMFRTDDVHESDPFIDNEQTEERNGSIGSEERSLNGANESIRNDFKLHRLEGGTFIVTATVYTDESRKHACGRATARVIVR